MHGITQLLPPRPVATTMGPLLLGRRLLALATLFAQVAGPSCPAAVLKLSPLPHSFAARDGQHCQLDGSWIIALPAVEALRRPAEMLAAGIQARTGVQIEVLPPSTNKPPRPKTITLHLSSPPASQQQPQAFGATDEGYRPPQCDVVSMYLDQINAPYTMTEAEAEARTGGKHTAFTAAASAGDGQDGATMDNGVGIAKALDIPVYTSIKAALMNGTDTLGVDAVVLIGEHGDYPVDELGRHMYPRKALFEQIAGVMAQTGKVVLGLYPIVTSQYSLTNLYQFYYHIR